jgi:hypothetical protein
MKEEKNIFSITFYNRKKETMHMASVSNVQASTLWCDRKGIKWTHAIAYNKLTGEKLSLIKNKKEYYKNNKK